MAVASASAASDDIASDNSDTSLALSDNAIESISTDDSASLSDTIEAADSVADDKSLGTPAQTDDSIDELNEENSVSAVSNLGEGSGNVIYVLENGSDANDGSSESSAVATLAKAIDIANASSATDHTIYVGNGNYYIEKLESPEGKNINLIYFTQFFY